LHGSFEVNLSSANAYAEAGFLPRNSIIRVLSYVSIGLVGKLDLFPDTSHASDAHEPTTAKCRVPLAPQRKPDSYLHIIRIIASSIDTLVTVRIIDYGERKHDALLWFFTPVLQGMPGYHHDVLTQGRDRKFIMAFPHVLHPV
jgi:hypothetical protein